MREAVAEPDGAGHGSPDVLVRVRGLLPEFTGALQQVAAEVLERPEQTAHATITELAERSGTSPATVTRFCRALGFDGYGDLRVAIGSELGRSSKDAWQVDIGRGIQPGDRLEDALAMLVATDGRAIEETASQLDLGEIERLVTAIAGARGVDLYGVGGSAVIALEMQLRLHRLGLRSWAWSEVHNALTSAAMLGEQDLALGISHSGRAKETVEMLAKAREQGATTAALTNFPRSPLTEHADIVLTTAVRETTFRRDALAARHSQLTVLDLIYVGVAQRTYDQTTAALATTAEAVQDHRIPEGEDARGNVRRMS